MRKTSFNGCLSHTRCCGSWELVIQSGYTTNEKKINGRFVMCVACNNVIGGDYKNGDIKIKGLRADKIFLVTHGLFGKKEISIDKSTVSRFEINNQ